MHVKFRNLEADLEANGLYILGHFLIPDGETVIPTMDLQPKAIALIGNAGSSIWPVFKAARGKRQGLTLDQWTQEALNEITKRFGINVLYPFEGPPFWPFTQWAIRTRGLFSSPIGLTIHPAFGLWHAFRAALLFDEDPGFSEECAESPCDKCENRPCLTTCPVSAFSGNDYRFNACLDYVGTGANSCRSEGCDARKACPIGQDYRYKPEHAAFHMDQLLRAHGKA